MNLKPYIYKEFNNTYNGSTVRVMRQNIFKLVI